MSFKNIDHHWGQYAVETLLLELLVREKKRVLTEFKEMSNEEYPNGSRGQENGFEEQEMEDDQTSNGSKETDEQENQTSVESAVKKKAVEEKEISSKYQMESVSVPISSSQVFSSESMKEQKDECYQQMQEGDTGKKEEEVEDQGMMDEETIQETRKGNVDEGKEKLIKKEDNGENVREDENGGKKNVEVVKSSKAIYVYKHLKKKRSSKLDNKKQEDNVVKPKPRLSSLQEQEQKNEKERKHTFKSPYTTCIISNTVDSRLLSRLELPAELQLQVMAYKTYKILLEGIQFAKPIPCEYQEEVKSSWYDSISEIGTSDNITERSSFPMLFRVFDRVYHGAIHPYSTVNMSALLRLWNESCQVAIKRTKNKYITALLGPLSTLLSSDIQSYLLKELLDSHPSIPPTDTWHLCFSLLYLNIKFCNKKVENRCLQVDRQDLVGFLKRCCEFDMSGGSDHQKKIVSKDLQFGKFLSSLSHLYIVGNENENRCENGVHLLMEVLVQILCKR